VVNTAFWFGLFFVVNRRSARPVVRIESPYLML
jgi:hypothetical protein